MLRKQQAGGRVVKFQYGLCVMVSLIAAALPMSAQEGPASPAGPIASAVARATVGLAVEPQAERADLRWAPVRALAAGTEVTVTLKGRPPVKRNFVAADGQFLTVLNLTDSALADTIRRLLDLAKRQPEIFTAGAVVYKDIQLGQEGLFVAGRRVADLGQVLEKIARDEVSEIATPVKTQGSWKWAATGIVAGVVLGFLTFLSALDCQPFHGCEVRVAAALGLPVAGGLVGYYAPVREKVGGVVYRAQ
jgi:hypothetical protein